MGSAYHCKAANLKDLKSIIQDDAQKILHALAAVGDAQAYSAFSCYLPLEAEYKHPFPTALFKEAEKKLELGGNLSQLHQKILGQPAPLVILVSKLQSQQLRNLESEKLSTRYVKPQCKHRSDD